MKFRQLNYFKLNYVSDASFSTKIGSGDIGDWRGEREILESAKSGEIRMKLDGKDKHKF